MVLTVGVLALQGAFVEHMMLLRRAASQYPSHQFAFLQVRTRAEVARCDALVIPGGESTTLSLVAERSGLLEPLREFVKVDRKPTWGTCAGLIVLAEEATSTKKGGQALIGGLDVTVHRNHFGRQTESFETTLALPFLDELEDDAGQGSPASFRAIFIRAPVIARLLPPAHGHSTDPDFGSTPQPSGQTHARDGGQVQVLARLGGEGGSDALGENRGDIVAVRQGNVFGTSFHPELTNDARIHSWWLLQIIKAYKDQNV